MKRIFLLITILLIFVSTGCLSLRTAEIKSFKVGLVAPTLGREASEGYRMACAAKKAIGEWNRGVWPYALTDGYYAELVIYDEGKDADHARKLLLDKQIIGVAGYSKGSKAVDAIKLFGPAHMPLIVVGVRDTPRGTLVVRPLELTAGNRTFWMAPDNIQLSEAIVTFIKEHLGSRTASIVAGPGLADLAQAEILRQKIEEQGISLARSEAALPYSSDYASVSSRLLQTPSDVIVVSGDSVASGEFL